MDELDRLLDEASAAESQRGQMRLLFASRALESLRPVALDPTIRQSLDLVWTLNTGAAGLCID